jgi:transcriptional regulator with XRE-family HTH domain
VSLANRGVAYALWREVESRRISQGLTKAELAKQTGLGRSTIDRLETGARAPLASTVHALADVLHIQRGEAETLAGLRPAAPNPNEQPSVRDAILASSAYTDEQRQMLLSMVDTIERANGLAANSDEWSQRRAI